MRIHEEEGEIITNLSFLQMFKNDKNVDIIRVIKPYMDEIEGFHPNVNTSIPNLAMSS